MMSKRDDAGFTLVEVMISMVISMTVLGAILGVLEGQMRVETRVHAFANNQEALRDAMVALQRDIRSSEPPTVLNSTADYKNMLELNVFTDMTSAPTRVQWRVTGGELVREDMSSGTPLVTHRLRGIDPTLDQVFFYFMADDHEMILTPLAPAVAPLPRDVAGCTVRIRIVLRAAPEKGPQPAPIQSDVQLRNRAKPEPGCPSP